MCLPGTKVEDSQVVTIAGEGMWRKMAAAEGAEQRVEMYFWR